MPQQRRFSFVCCVNRPEVARHRLLASPCLHPGAGHQLVLLGNAASAGWGMQTGLALARHEWMVFLHQDVHLPEGWDALFSRALNQSLAENPAVAVVGVYGVQTNGTHVGFVFDRDRWIGQPMTSALPVGSLDELLIAVRVSSGLYASPELGWHLYGTDICLAAQAHNLAAVVLHAPCEHHSSLPRLDHPLTQLERETVHSIAQAYAHSAEVLLRRWPLAVPVHTPVLTLTSAFSRQDLMSWVNQL